MEKLEKIWHKLDELEKAIGKIVTKNVVEETYQKLKKEETAHKKWMPWMLPYLFMLMVFMTWLTNAYTSIVSMVGIGLITIGGYAMCYFFQKNRIPLDNYEANPTAANFDKFIRKPLKNRIHYWALGIAIYTLSLTFGLHLLIFGIGSLAGKGGLLGTFYGIMFGLTGWATGGMYALQTQWYGDVFNPKLDLQIANFKIQ